MLKRKECKKEYEKEKSEIYPGISNDMFIKMLSATSLNVQDLSKTIDRELIEPLKYVAYDMQKDSTVTGSGKLTESYRFDVVNFGKKEKHERRKLGVSKSNDI